MTCQIDFASGNEMFFGYGYGENLHLCLVPGLVDSLDAAKVVLGAKGLVLGITQVLIVELGVAQKNAMDLDS